MSLTTPLAFSSAITVSYWAASVSTTFTAIYTSDEVAHGLFGTTREAVLAGQLAPMGRAVVDGDGYVISGSYRFASGSDQTTHMLAGCLLVRDGEMVLRDNGMPEVVAAVIPNDHVEFKGNWDVMGLSGTASVDYEVAPILSMSEHETNNAIVWISGLR